MTKFQLSKKMETKNACFILFIVLFILTCTTIIIFYLIDLSIWRSKECAKVENSNSTIEPDVNPVNIIYNLDDVEEVFTQVGKVNGKIFMMRRNRPMNWTTARDFCASQYMKLASIQTQAEYNLLLKGINKLFNVSWKSSEENFWTNAREVRGYSEMMRWDETEEEMNLQVLNVWGVMNALDEPYRFCGILTSNNDNGPEGLVQTYMVNTLCSDIIQGTLCQK